jgi:hypothetical protein
MEKRNVLRGWLDFALPSFKLFDVIFVVRELQTLLLLCIRDPVTAFDPYVKTLK